MPSLALVHLSVGSSQDHSYENNYKMTTQGRERKQDDNTYRIIRFAPVRFSPTPPVRVVHSMP